MKKEKCICFTGKEHDPICDCGCHDEQPKVNDWENKLEEIFRLWHYDRERNNGIDEVKQFIQSLLQSQRKEILEEILEKFPPSQEEPIGINEFGEGFANGYNRAIKGIKNSLEELIKK